MSREIKPDSDYSAKLLKLIPSEIIAAFIAIDGILSTSLNIRQPILIGSLVFLTVLIPFYLRFLFNVKNPGQIIVTMISFLVWVFSIGGPFLSYFWYQKALGAVVLILWTLIIPMFRYTKEGP